MTNAPNLSPRRQVLQVYPSAYVEKQGSSYFIMTYTRTPHILGYSRMTEAKAWEEAAQRIKEEAEDE